MEEELTFIEKNNQEVMKLIQAKVLDEVGFEDESFAFRLGELKEKEDGIPLTNLIGKLKEVTCMIPVIKRLVSRQNDLTLKM